MDNKIKRIIAREGLIALGVFVALVILEVANITGRFWFLFIYPLYILVRLILLDLLLDLRDIVKRKATEMVGREALIALWIVGYVIVSLFIGAHGHLRSEAKFYWDVELVPANIHIDQWIYIGLGFYAFFALIRFVIWVVRILIQKDQLPEESK